MLTSRTETFEQADHQEMAAAVELTPRGSWTEAPCGNIADAVRYCHNLAVALNATAFSLLFCVQNVETRRLAPVFDDAFPNVSPLSRVLGGLSSQMANGILGAQVPAWWRPAEEPPFLTAPARRWTCEIDCVADGTSGIAFPVSVEHGRTGAVVFTGDDMILDEIALCETHARCHALFAGVVQSHRLADEPRPTMSKREIECLRLTANGLTSDEISTSLGLSVHTANQYLTNSTHKLNAVNRIHAVAKALRIGLID